MQKIIPHLWFDNQAKEAAFFYTSIFPNSKITSTSVIFGTPSGDCDIVSFDLSGYSFMAISAGPIFTFNPSISFTVNFDPSRDKNASKKLDDLWGKLIEGGTALMPLQEYPFSKKYGWVKDKYGLTWQLILVESKDEERSFIVPSLIFVGSVAGKAEEAITYYRSIFKKSKLGQVSHYGPNQEPNKEGMVAFSDFKLEGQWFIAMDSAFDHKYSFNEAVSLLINCEDQAEIDYYFEKLSAVKEAEQCGWLKDKFGVSWQVSPTIMNKMMSSGTKEQIARVTKTFLKMKKFDISKLKKAYETR